MERSTILASPPKLSFDFLPRHQTEPSGMVTPPPFRFPAAVPFIWEEEPGRPRKESLLSKPNQKPFSARSLELPPRMVAEELKMKASKKDTVSPTSILDVPRALSRPRSFRSCYSFNHGNGRSRGDGGKENDRTGDDMLLPRERRRESRRAYSSLVTSSSSCSSSCGCDDGKGHHVRITRFRRHRSLSNVSWHTTSHFWLGIYKSLRQIVPWHRTRCIPPDMAPVTLK